MMKVDSGIGGGLAGIGSVRTHYPVGGTSKKNGGQGIFKDASGENIEVWIDTALRDRIPLVRYVLEEGGSIAVDHTEENVHLLILSPGSTPIFDMYCHPDWMTNIDRRLYERKRTRRGKFEEEWTKKVLLKAWWLEECKDAGRYLGVDDNWAGCRAGGPPLGVAMDNSAQAAQIVDSEKEAITLQAYRPPTPQSSADEPLMTNRVPVSSQVDMDIDDDDDSQSENAVEAMTIDEPEEPLHAAQQGPSRQPPARTDQEQLLPPTKRARGPHTYTREAPLTSPENPVFGVPRFNRKLNAVQAAKIRWDRYRAEKSKQGGTIGEDGDTPGEISTEDVEAESSTGGGAESASSIQRRSRVVRSQERDEEDGEQEGEEEDLVPRLRRRKGAPASSEEVEEVEDPSWAPGRSMRILPSRNTIRARRVIDEEDDEPKLSASIKQPLGMGGAIEVSVPVANDFQRSGDDSAVDEVTQRAVNTTNAASEIVQASPTKGKAKELSPATPQAKAKEEPATPAPLVPAELGKLFEGLRFWVDLRKPDRQITIRRIRAAGGMLCAEYAEATHVLVHDYNKATWDPIIKDIVPLGIWFMPFSWVNKCLDAGAKYPEVGEHLPGGAPILLGVNPKSPQSATKSMRDTRSASLASRRKPSVTFSPSKHSKSSQAARLPGSPEIEEIQPERERTAIELHLLFEEATEATQGGSEAALVAYIKNAGPGSFRKKADCEIPTMLTEWRERKGFFRKLPRDLPTVDGLAVWFQDLQDKIDTEEVTKDWSLHEIGQAYPGVFENYYDWNDLWQEWANRNGRFARIPRRVDRSTGAPEAQAGPSSTPSIPAGSPAEVDDNGEDVSASGEAKTIKDSPRSKKNKLSRKEIEDILDKECAKLLIGYVNGQLARILHDRYPQRTREEWRKDIDSWYLRVIQGAPTPSKPVQLREEQKTEISGSPSRFPIPPTTAPLAAATETDSSIPDFPNIDEEDVRSDDALMRIFSVIHARQHMTGLQELCAAAYEKYRNYSRTTLYNYYLTWKRGAGRFNLYGPKASPKPYFTKDKVQPGPPVIGEKRRRESDTSPFDRTAKNTLYYNSKKGQPYTDEEHKMMAEYVFSRIPHKSSSVKDWGDFAVDHPERTAGAWSQHLHASGGWEVGRYVAEMLKAGKPSQGFPQSRTETQQRFAADDDSQSDNDSDSVTFLDPPQTGKRKTELVDITGDDRD